jgi:ribosomal protein S18 acetylase RimI-like enzyme
MEIRSALPTDTPAIVALWERVFGYPEARNRPERVVATKRDWDSMLLVAADLEALVGTLMVGYDGHRGWLYRLAVDPKHQRQGIGRRLVQRAEQMLLALGCTKVNLQLHTSNTRAVGFWQAVGYGEEARISMGKDLTSEGVVGRDAGC